MILDDEREQFVTDLTQFCTVCKAHVQPRSKHCGSCNRCTEHFDHHCVWLNNCIGKKNYLTFFILVIALIILKGTKMMLNVMVFLDPNDMMSVAILGLIVDPFILLALIYLLGMHIYFLSRKITTYDWIRERQEVKEKVLLTQKQTKEQQLMVQSGNKGTKTSTHGYGIMLSSRQVSEVRKPTIKEEEVIPQAEEESNPNGNQEANPDGPPQALNSGLQMQSPDETNRDIFSNHPSNTKLMRKNSKSHPFSMKQAFMPTSLEWLLNQTSMSNQRYSSTGKIQPPKS